MDSQLKYIMYCRKSTEGEDRQILSLPAQKRELEEYAKKNGLHIVKYLEEAQSAYKVGRPGFNKMMEMINKGEADGILVWALNRIARNARDGGDVIYALDEEVIKEIRTPSATIKPTSNDKFILQIEFAMSKKSSDDNSESVKRGNREKLNRGHDYRRHLGYMFVEDPQTGEKLLQPDPERFDLLKKAIHLILGGMSPMNALNILNGDWLFRTRKTRKTGEKPLSPSGFYKLLNDPFYCGFMKNGDGEEIIGSHVSMIREYEFEKLQEILGAKGRPRPRTLTLPYRGLIFCGECECTVCLEEKHQLICDVCKEKFAYRQKTECPACGTPIAQMKSPKKLKYTYAGCTKKKRSTRCSQRSHALGRCRDHSQGVPV